MRKLGKEEWGPNPSPRRAEVTGIVKVVIAIREEEDGEKIGREVLEALICDWDLWSVIEVTTEELSREDERGRDE